MKRFAYFLCLAGVSMALARAQEGPATLRYHWVGGDVLSVVEKNRDVTYAQSDSGDAESEQTLQTDFGHSWKIMSVDSDGTATISVSFDYVRIDVAVDHVPKLVFDSLAPVANTGDPTTLSIVSDYVGALKATTLTLKISASGEVQSVGGIDELTDQLRDVAEKEKTKFKFEDRVMADQLMEAMVSSEASPKTYSFMMVAAPGKPVSSGDSWVQKLEIPFQRVSLRITRNLLVREVSSNSIRIEVGTLVELPADKTMPYEVENVPGLAEFSRQAGLPRTIEWGFRVKGPLFAQKDGQNVRVGHSEETIQTRLEFLNKQSPAREFNSPEYKFSASFPCTADEKIADPSRGEGVNLSFLAPSRIMVFKCVKKDRYVASIEVAELASAGQTALEQVVNHLTNNPIMRVTGKQIGILQGYPSVKIDSVLTLVQGSNSHYMVVATEHRVYNLMFTRFATNASDDDGVGKAFLQSFHLITEGTGQQTQ